MTFMVFACVTTQRSDLTVIVVTCAGKAQKEVNIRRAMKLGSFIVCVVGRELAHNLLVEEKLI